MKEFSLKLKAILLAIFLTAGVTAMAAVPQARQKAEVEAVYDRCYQGQSLSTKALCIQIRNEGKDETLEKAESVFSACESFLGLYPFPDTELIEQIALDNTPEKWTGAVQTFELNEGLLQLPFLTVKEGRLFDLSDVTDDTLPVVITDNFDCNVGDTLTLTVNTDDLKTGDEETLHIKAVVCGIVENNRELPFAQTGSGALLATVRNLDNDTVVLYTPDLSSYRKQYDYVYPYDDTWVPYYALFSAPPDNEQYEKMEKAIGENAYLDLRTTDQVVRLRDTLSDLDYLLEPDGIFKTSYDRQLILTYVLGGVAEAVLLVLLGVLIKRRKDAEVM